MSRFRLYPTPEQEVILREHCAHARFVWNLAVEQQSWWWPGRGSAVGVDRGVVVSAALSTGELLTVPRLSPGRSRRLVRFQRKLARAKRGDRKSTRPNSSH